MTRPLFIVGASRSGTELARQVINRLGSYHIAHETHYFGDLRPRLGPNAAAPIAQERIGATCDYFRALHGSAYGLGGDPENAPISRADLQAAAGPSPSGDALFAAHCRDLATRQGARRWGEKTPRHLFACDTILQAFPDARILVMLRDPRAVVASYRDWRNRWFDDQAIDDALARRIAQEERRTARSYHPLIIALMWRAAARRAAKAATTHGDSVRLLRFEDLIAQPEIAVRQLCDWLDIAFEADALQVRVQNSSYAGADSERGFVPDFADRWRDRLSATEVALIEYVAGADMRRLGYMMESPSPAPIEALRIIVSFPIAVARAACANRHRNASLMRFVLDRIR